MPTALQNLIDDCQEYYESAWDYGSYTALDLASAGAALKSEDLQSAGSELQSAAQNFSYFRRDVLTRYYTNKFKIIQALEWINDNWPEDAVEITMDDILSAMVTATIDDLEYFIGLVDAYRVALWNKPFNAEFYAALARGFAGL